MTTLQSQSQAAIIPEAGSRSITILGSTGSVGAHTVDLVLRTPGRFTVEVSIPASAFDRTALRPADYKLAFYRMSGRAPHRTYQARFPTLTERPNFHVPERFGWIRLVRR